MQEQRYGERERERERDRERERERERRERGKLKLVCAYYKDLKERGRREVNS